LTGESHRPVTRHWPPLSHNDGYKKWNYDSECTLNVYSKWKDGQFERLTWKIHI
jgi:hypothetical protein